MRWLGGITNSTDMFEQTPGEIVLILSSITFPDELTFKLFSLFIFLHSEKSKKGQEVFFPE